MTTLTKAAKLLIQDMANCPMLNGDEDIIAMVEIGEYSGKQNLMLKVAERVFSAVSSCASLPPRTIAKHLFLWLRKHDFDLSTLVDFAEESLKSASWNLQYIIGRNPGNITKEQINALELAIDLSQTLYKALGSKPLSTLRGELQIAQHTLHDAQAAYALHHPTPAPKSSMFARFLDWLCELIGIKDKPVQVKLDRQIGHNPLILTSSMAKVMASDVGKKTMPQPIPIIASQSSFKTMQPTPPLESFTDLKI